MRFLSIPLLFCAHSVSQNQVKAPPFISLIFRSMSQFLSTPFGPFFIPSLHQRKQCKPWKTVQIYRYANQFNDHLLSSESFSSRQNRSRSPICFSLWRDTSSYWADCPSIILIDYFFMLFRSVKCHWSLVDGFFPASRIFSIGLLCSDPSISQSVKALSTAISHSGQDSGQDVHPHTRSILPLALSS